MNTAQATECNDVIKSCDAAIEARKQEIKLCNLALVQSEDRNQGLNAELERKDEQLRSPFRNPFVMVAAGVVLGIIVTGLATRGK